jgi:NAD(P)H-hydrate epimerase
VLWPKGDSLFLLEKEDIRQDLVARAPDSNKGEHGKVAIVAGSRGKAGAAILAARGALRAGAGLVTVLCIESIQDAVVSALPEAMTLGLPEEKGAISEAAAKPAIAFLKRMDAAVVGPGLGTAPGTVRFLEEILAYRHRLGWFVLDADALNAFAGRSRLWRYFAGRTITPHPGEAGRLLGVSARQVQADRIGAARQLAQRTRTLVVLKGAGTIISDPAGSHVAINPTGSALMATAGAGDVLSGVIAALRAKSMTWMASAWAGPYLHGLAGERLAHRLGDAGLLAHELADEIPLARREILRS